MYRGIRYLYYKPLKSFDEGKRRLRLDSIKISIDGADARIHDEFRGVPGHPKEAGVITITQKKEGHETLP